MSRKTCRHQAAAWLRAGQIAGIGTVYASPPKISRSSDALAGVPTGTQSGSVVYVEVFESPEVRVALGGPHGGKKMITHTMTFHLLFRSKRTRAEAAMDDHDDILESILERLRADRTLGTTEDSENPIFQAGEGDFGIHASSGLPKDTGTGSLHIWTLITFEVQEFITS